MEDSLVLIGEDERVGAVDTIVAAFAADPVERWLFPDDAAYLRDFPPFVEAFGGLAFETGTAWRLDDLSAVALWLAPGIEPDGDVIVELLMAAVAPDQHDDLLATLGQMVDQHPAYPHWYLPWLGVQTPRQGQGLGGRLLVPCLEIVDAAHLPAYLETPNPRTVPFYERHGFAVVGEAQAGACPPLVLMLRPAR